MRACIQMFPHLQQLFLQTRSSFKQNQHFGLNLFQVEILKCVALGCLTRERLGTLSFISEGAQKLSDIAGSHLNSSRFLWPVVTCSPESSSEDEHALEILQAVTFWHKYPSLSEDLTTRVSVVHEYGLEPFGHFPYKQGFMKSSYFDFCLFWFLIHRQTSSCL